ncbi:YbaB/EbfC family nucleoid-associated protein [Anaeromassilibacillus sp. An200]|uniref:Nucleoid-associated protein IAB89_00500 n=2 Tax=Candidatus Caccousia TaxID=2840638 RepID=A0A9D1AKI9_9FIRM|nr:YbaB/EbfC family nucleoid-associated protein [Anaeromassilibacillus sp. An200]OUP12021.1 YbaB/EbfC family nucleoid-associated protein [Anaeromassilibacillus sp. An200]HIR46129.1 YbaB/EbfC family nucleoid-associated protein [Candidatus Caccousia avicola]HIS79205.1 YbaB/EbfC family nucleoid-associated protein [Candidatus Caccousia stercoris]
MKARLPQGYGGGGAANLQQIARQAQKLQEEMDAVSTELETTEYSATAGGDAVKAIVTGKMEIKSLEIKPEVVDPEDVEMLSDLVIAAVNEALRAAVSDKSERMEKISGGLNMPGLF